MTDFDRHLVVDLPFHRTLAILATALADAGFLVGAATDLRAALARHARGDLRRYTVLSTLHLATVERALKTDLDVGAWALCPLVVYELPDGETAIAGAEPLGLLATARRWDDARPDLAEAARTLAMELARVFEAVQRRARAGRAARTATDTPRGPAAECPRHEQAVHERSR